MAKLIENIVYGAACVALGLVCVLAGWGVYNWYQNLNFY